MLEIMGGKTMRRYWLGLGLVWLTLLSACSGGTPEPEQTIEMSLRSPGLESLESASLTTTTSALQVIGLINPPGVKVTYNINGGEEKDVTIVDGAFTFLATLEPGENTIAVTASLIINPSIRLTKTFKVIYEPTVPGGLAYGGALDPNGPTMTRPDTGDGLTDEERTSPYSAYTFNIDTTAWYAVTSTQTFDGYLLLYEGSFDPNNPEENLLAQNDDFPSAFDPDIPLGGSRVRAELEPGQYIIVTTAYSTPSPEETLEFSNLIARTDPPPPPFQLPAPDDSRFNITVRFLTTNVTAQQQQAFVDAANRWARIIRGDLTNIELPNPVELNPNGAAVVGTIDDVLIDAAFVDIDGPSAVLGRAGPRFIRSSGPNAGLTIYGSMEFDIAEFAPGGFFDDPKGYSDVILHEMGHVLGIGTLWGVTDNLSSNFDPDAPTDLPIGTPNPDYDPRFIGARASAEYEALLAEAGKTDTPGVPIENTGGPGSINSHWRELIFGPELMSPSAAGSEALSKMTAASLGDMGYRVNVNSRAIDPYSLPADPSFVQLAPTERTFVYPTEFLGLSGGTGVAEGAVQAVDLKIDETADPTDPTSNHPANSTSGCEAEDFADFTPGNIALIQRGVCAFVDKVDNAAAAGATGVIIFNQGNTPERKLLFGAASSGLPGVSIPFDLGVTFANTPGLEVRIDQGGEASLLSAAAVKPTFQEELLLPVGTISPNGKLGGLPQ
jgi:hypothetical protein